jgi:hypothetical protein
MKTGTCYFPSYGAALRYYRPYCLARESRRGDRTRFVRVVIDDKLNAGEIHIGKPATKPGETLSIEDNRYHVTSR